MEEKNIFSENLEEIETIKNELVFELKDFYEQIKKTLNKYMDMNENDLEIITAWITSSFFRNVFSSFPYLFINAQKASGKTRLLKLLCEIAEGTFTVNVTEAVLFRRSDPLFIDELESITTKEKAGLRELLNAAYKKGSKIQRVRKIEKTGECVIDEFEVFRTIAMANIAGMEDVLQDRCVTVVLERSIDKIKTRMIEAFDIDSDMIKIKEMRKNIQRFENEIKEHYIYFIQFLQELLNKYVNENKTYNDEDEIIKELMCAVDSTERQASLNFLIKIWKSEIFARDLEIYLPLLITHFIAYQFETEKFDSFLQVVKKKIIEKQVEDVISNKDNMTICYVYEYINQTAYVKNNFTYLKDIVYFIKTQKGEEWVENKWLMKSLTRLKLLKEKKRTGRGIALLLDEEKIEKKARALGYQIEKEVI